MLHLEIEFRDARKYEECDSAKKTIKKNHGFNRTMAKYIFIQKNKEFNWHTPV